MTLWLVLQIPVMAGLGVRLVWSGYQRPVDLEIVDGVPWVLEESGCILAGRDTLAVVQGPARDMLVLSRDSVLVAHARGVSLVGPWGRREILGGLFGDALSLALSGDTLLLGVASPEPDTPAGAVLTFDLRGGAAPLLGGLWEPWSLAVRGDTLWVLDSSPYPFLGPDRVMRFPGDTVELSPGLARSLGWLDGRTLISQLGPPPEPRTGVVRALDGDTLVMGLGEPWRLVSWEGEVLVVDRETGKIYGVSLEGASP